MLGFLQGSLPMSKEIFYVSTHIKFFYVHQVPSCHQILVNLIICCQWLTRKNYRGNGTIATTTSVWSKEQNIKISNSKVGKERALNLVRMEQDLVKFKNIKKELDQDVELTIHQLQFTTTHKVKKCLMKSNKYIEDKHIFKPLKRYLLCKQVLPIAATNRNRPRAMIDKGVGLIRTLLPSTVWNHSMFREKMIQKRWPRSGRYVYTTRHFSLHVHFL